MTSKMWWWILKVRRSLLVFSLIGTIHLFTPSFIFRESICGTHGTVSAYSQALAPVPPQRQKPARLPSFTSFSLIFPHWCPSLIRCSSCKHLTSNPSAEPHSGGGELTFHRNLTPQWRRLLLAFMSGAPVLRLFFGPSLGIFTFLSWSWLKQQIKVGISWVWCAARHPQPSLTTRALCYISVSSSSAACSERSHIKLAK